VLGTNHTYAWNTDELEVQKFSYIAMEVRYCRAVWCRMIGQYCG